MIRDLLTLLRISLLWWQAHSLAVTIDGRAICMDVVRDPLTLAGMRTAQALAINEHRRLRREIDAAKRSLQHLARAA